MRNQRITDTDAAAVMGGTAPADRPELADVATALSAFRVAALEPPPQPSAALRERLEIGALGGAATQLPEEITRTRVGDARRRAARRARLTVGASIALGLGLATVTVTSVGAVGLLPGGAQEAFDRVVSAVLQEAPESKTPTGTTVESPVDVIIEPDATQPDGETPVDPTPSPSPSTVPTGETPTPTPTPTPETGDKEKKDKEKEKEKDKADKVKNEKQEKEKKQSTPGETPT